MKSFKAFTASLLKRLPKELKKYIACYDVTIVYQAQSRSFILTFILERPAGEVSAAFRIPADTQYALYENLDGTKKPFVRTMDQMCEEIVMVHLPQMIRNAMQDAPEEDEG